jgi:phage virion morphogenesis protein
MITVTIEESEIHEALSILQRRVADLSPVMADIAEMLHTLTDEAFSSERAPDGSAWPDLAPSTWRRKKSPRKLFESGTLAGSLHAESTSTEARVGVNATRRGFPYGVVHQFGSSKRHIPARPFLPVTEDGRLYDNVVEEIVEMMQEWLTT